MRARDILLLLLLAALYTGLAAIKPIHIDEAANVYYARHIAEHPFDPYGFAMFWYQGPQPANQVLTPPLLVYWESLAVKLFGERPILWKLWLLPFALVFVFSLHALLRRFAPGTEMALTWMTVLSPAFLPSLNLMPDIPALAWSLLAVVVFLRGEDRSQESGVRSQESGVRARYAARVRWRTMAWTILAGLIAGIGMQTKYTGFITLGVLLLRALLTRRYGLGLVTAGIAASVFVGWEALVAWKYGNSHFWYQVRESGASLFLKGFLILPLPSILGGVAAGIGLLGFVAVGARRWIVAGGAAAVAAALIVLACVGVTWQLDIPWPTWLGGSGEPYPQWLTLASVVWGVVGIVPIVAGGWLAWRSWERAGDGTFLVLWLGLEVAGYFMLSPFPAVRRVLGIVVVLTLLVGRASSPSPYPLPLAAGEGSSLPPLPLRGGEGRVRGRSLNGLAWPALIAGNMALGLLFFIVDVYDARAEMLGARAAAQVIADAGGRVWYAGHWGFQYYAEQAGMTPVVPDESVLRPGDWLVLPGEPVVRQDIGSPDGHSDLVVEESITDWLPWRTVVGYYGGAEPLDHCRGARLVVEVRRVTVQWTPAP